MNNASQPVNICSSSARAIMCEEKKHTENIVDVNVMSETHLVEDVGDLSSIAEGEDVEGEEVLSSDNVATDEATNLGADEAITAELLNVAGNAHCSQPNTNPRSMCSGCKAINPQFQCMNCKSVKYCSKTCQQKCWESHKILCESIQQLSKEIVDSKPTMFLSHITPANRNKLVKLIGEKCELDVELSDIKTRVLWDTGSMVSIVDRSWLNENLPNESIRDVQELLDEQLHIRTANKTALPFCGWVELTFKLHNCELKVPFLVAENEMDRPIIGFNVILSFMKLDKLAFIEALSQFSEVSSDKVECVVNLLTKIEDDYLSIVKLRNKTLLFLREML